MERFAAAASQPKASLEEDRVVVVETVSGKGVLLGIGGGPMGPWRTSPGAAAGQSSSPRVRSRLLDCPLSAEESAPTEQNRRWHGFPVRTGHPVTIGGSKPLGRNEGTRSSSSVADRLSALAPVGAITPMSAPDRLVSTVGKLPISRPQPSYRKTVPTILTRGTPEPEILVYTPQVVAVMPILTPQRPQRGALARGGNRNDQQRIGGQ